MSNIPNICIVGGGMITQVQILPSIYQLQRLGLVGDISICALNSGPLKTLAQDQTLKQAYPGQSFTVSATVRNSGCSNQRWRSWRFIRVRRCDFYAWYLMGDAADFIVSHG